MQESDSELLRAYAERGSEAAFTELVTRHVQLVYAAALRQVNDAHLAQDVTQSVFIALARKAGKLRHAFVAGWLYRSVCFESAKAKRGAARRQARERQALEMHFPTAPSNPNPDWEVLAPMLDDAMSQLADKDRDAVLIRYFQNRDLKTVGERLGASEDAAQKRVARALEKLRGLLARDGVTLSSTTLAAALASQTINAAPPGLVAGVTTAALAGAAKGTSLTLSLFKLMTSTKFKAASIAALLLAVVAGLVLQNQSLAHVRHENAALREQVTQLTALRANDAGMARLQTDAAELDRLRQQHADLLRLRGEVAQLRRELQERKQALALSPPPESAQTNLSPVQLTIEATFVEAPPAVLAALGLENLVQGSTQWPVIGILADQKSIALFHALKQAPGVDILSAPKVTTLDRRQAQIKVVNLLTIRTSAGDWEQQEVGPMLDVLPVVAPNHSTVELTATAAMKKFLGYSETEPIQPIFRNFSATAHAIVFDGQTLVLTGPQKQSVGELPADAKQIIVLITPTLIDPAGNRLHLPNKEEQDRRSRLPSQAATVTNP